MTTQQESTPAAGVEREWLSRREMALLIHRSEDTVKRDVKEHGLATRLGGSGEVQVRVADFVALGRLRPGDVPAGLTPGQAAELHRCQAENARLAAQVAELTGRLQALLHTQDVVIAQLATKDAQIAAKDQQLKETLAAIRSQR
ncbi:MAG: hypothetical protein ACTHK1_11755 [Actinomycetales bacterium]